MKPYLSFVLLFLFASLPSMSAQGQSDVHYMRAMYKKGKKHEQQKNYEKARSAYEESLILARKFGDQIQIQQIENRLRELNVGWEAGLRFVFKYKKMLFIKTILIIISTLISIILGIIKLRKYLKDKRTQKDIPPNAYFPETIRKARRFYVQTKWQNVPPSKENEPGDTFATATKEKVIPFMTKKVFRSKVNKKFFLVLGGSGMGKSTFMINLFFKAKRKGYKVALLHIARPETWEK